MCMGVLPARVSVYHVCEPGRAEEGVISFVTESRWLLTTTRLLGTEPQSYVRSTVLLTSELALQPQLEGV